MGTSTSEEFVFMSEPEYGDKFEGAVIFAMTSLIILAFIGVFALKKATYQECTASDYTYCGDSNEH